MLHLFNSFLTFFLFQPRSSGAAMKTPGWPGLRLRRRGTDQLQNHDHKNWLVLCVKRVTKALYWFQISCGGIKVYFMSLKSVFFIYLVINDLNRTLFKMYTLLFHKIKLEGRVSPCAMLLLAWQCLSPSHEHVLFNNVGIFYCFAFITAREAKTENRNRKPDALKAELYRPTTVKCNNMSIWIQKQGFLTGCLLNSAVFSSFPLLLEFSFLLFSALWKAAPLSLTTHWPSTDFRGKGVKAWSRRGVFPW